MTLRPEDMARNDQVVRCAKCLMPRNTHGLSFDEHGVCSLCTECFQTPNAVAAHRTIASLEDTIKMVRKRGTKAPFDCVVGVSGGMDSVYLLHLLTRKHGLRCLAAYYRTPFTPVEIDQSVKRIASLLSVPLVEIQLSREYHRQVAAYFVRLWKGSHEQTLVNLACAPCKLLHRELFRIARQWGIRTVVHGDNQYEHVNLAAGQFRTNTRNRYSVEANVLRLFLIGARGMVVLFRHPRVLRHFGLAVRASILYLNPYTLFLRLRYPSIRTCNYFHEAEWNEQELNHVLGDLGWDLPKGFCSRKKADCTFAHLKNVMTSLTVGANYFDCFYSNMIRFGLMGREEAFRRLQHEGRPPRAAINEAYRVLGLPEDYITS